MKPTPNKELEYKEFRKTFESSEEGKNVLKIFDSICLFLDKKDYKTINRQKYNVYSYMDIPVAMRAAVGFHKNGVGYIEYLIKKQNKGVKCPTTL